MLVARLSLRAKLLLAPLVAILVLGVVAAFALFVLDGETRRASRIVDRGLLTIEASADIAPALADAQTAARRLAAELTGTAATQSTDGASARGDTAAALWHAGTSADAAKAPANPAANPAAERATIRAALARSADALSRLQDAATLPPSIVDAARAFAFELRPYRGALDDLIDPAPADAATIGAILAATERHAERLQHRAGELVDSVAMATREDDAALLMASRAAFRLLLGALLLALPLCLGLAVLVTRRAIDDITLLARLVERLRETGCAAERGGVTGAAGATSAAGAAAGAPTNGVAANASAGMTAGDAGAALGGAHAYPGVSLPGPADFSGAMEALAFRSNLLALNAAVEAARATGINDGFATVAADARRLAQASTLMAEECRWQQKLAQMHPDSTPPAPLAETLPTLPGAFFSPPQATLRDAGHD